VKLVNSATRMRVPSSRCSTMPMDEASMAQAARPASAYSRNARCSRTGSGVVMPVDSMAGGIPTPSVPTRAQPLRSCSFTWASACASHQAVVVLPLVPVTASTSIWALGCWNHWSAIRPVAALRPGKAAMCSPEKPKGSTPCASTRQATAPRSRAEATWARPSVAAPGQAMKASPGRTLRLSVCSVPLPCRRAASHWTASVAVDSTRRAWEELIARAPPRGWRRSRA